jgi:hypothetical protein
VWLEGQRLAELAAPDPPGAFGLTYTPSPTDEDAAIRSAEREFAEGKLSVEELEREVELVLAHDRRARHLSPYPPVQMEKVME